MAGAAAALLLAGPAKASLIFDNTITQTGTGLGAVSTILTIQATGQGMGGSETGSVTWNGSADVLGGADVKTGASQTLTRTVGSLGLTDAGQIAIVFNADQPAGGAITLSNLHLVITNSAGTTLFDSGAFTSASFASTDHGIGNSGAVFELDAAGIAAANSAGAFGNANNRIGLVASATPGNGGPETFFVGKVTQPTSVPEPASLAILGTGLLGYSLLRRRKR
jgi:hypothetical protein